MRIKVARPFRKRSPDKEEVPQPLPPPPELEDGHELRMGFFEHLDELRHRLTKIAIALVLGTIVGFIIAGPIFDSLRGPYCQVVASPDDCQLVVLGPTEGVFSYFRVSLMIGGIIAIPLITYQIMGFIFPGLTRKERHFVIMALPAIYGLFIIGVAFSWEILMPPALGFLEGFQPSLFKPEWTADLYLSFVTSLLFWMGVAFETPLVFFVLSLLGLVSAGPLIRNWRIAIVGAAIAAAVITPTIDPVNMFLVMAPLLTLYLISIVLVVIGRRIAKIS